MGEKALNAIDRYQELIETTVGADLVMIYKDELQELLDYVQATEAWLAEKDGAEQFAKYAALQEKRKKLGLTESSPSAPKG